MEPWWWKHKHKHKINANGSSDMKHFTELERVLGRCFNSNCVPIEISKLLSIINFIKKTNSCSNIELMTVDKANKILNVQ